MLFHLNPKAQRTYAIAFLIYCLIEKWVWFEKREFSVQCSAYFNRYWAKNCVFRLQLRSMLLPEVVNQVEALEKSPNKKKPQLKTWSVSPDMFPTQLSPDTLSQAKEVKSFSLSSHSFSLSLSSQNSCFKETYFVSAWLPTSKPFDHRLLLFFEAQEIVWN